MSGDASAGARDDDASEWAGMLATLDTAIDEATRKVESGRVRDAENEAVRIKWIRALAYLVSVRRQVQADRDLEDLADRLERLEDAQGAAREVVRS